MTHTNHARDRPGSWRYPHAEPFSLIQNLF